MSPRRVSPTIMNDSTFIRVPPPVRAHVMPCGLTKRALVHRLTPTLLRRAEEGPRETDSLVKNKKVFYVSLNDDLPIAELHGLSNPISPNTFPSTADSCRKFDDSVKCDPALESSRSTTETPLTRFPDFLQSADVVKAMNGGIPLAYTVESANGPTRRLSTASTSFASNKDVPTNYSDDIPKRKLSTSSDCVKGAFVDFCEQTTFHGVNMVFSTSHITIQVFWVILSMISICCLIFQYSLVFEKYARKDKIVNVELEFESAPFPAITVCNLNPFKKHLARSVPEISETLDAFHQAVVYSNDAQFDYSPGRSKRDLKKNGGFKFLQYEPVYSDCECKKGKGNECIGLETVPKTLKDACICNYDRQDGSTWPCYSASTWEESICPECNDVGFCNVPNTTGTDNIPCFCQLELGYCMLKPESRLRRIWEFKGKHIPEKGSELRKDFLEHLQELGYGNMTDQVAITTQAREKMILKMSALHPQRRAALGYGKSELIKMCSFNGQQCDIENEFKLHIDPSFGNCYTFNGDSRKSQFSSRAGPSYGLRLMLFVNSSDYLPTTEATGVRIAIHGQRECPFPDTFGYSAPTGAISSFGLSLRKVNRLPKPYGDCYGEEKLPLSYIYKGYKYEPEGCYRSCYQRRIIDRCGCADPRFPNPSGRAPFCDSQNNEINNCLFTEGAKLSKKKSHCKCIHPCKQDQYSTTYSAAKWPSGSIQVTCEVDSKDCNKYYSEHAAMIEIYYEQMSYEILKESESYSVVNLISDMGGQAGLWLGASIMSVMEFVIFIVRILSIACAPRKNKDKDRILREDFEKDAKPI